MGKNRDAEIRASGGTPWREEKAETWLDDSGIVLDGTEYEQWLHDLAARIRMQALPPLQLRL